MDSVCASIPQPILPIMTMSAAEFIVIQFIEKKKAVAQVVNTSTTNKNSYGAYCERLYYMVADNFRKGHSVSLQCTIYQISDLSKVVSTSPYPNNVIFQHNNI